MRFKITAFFTTLFAVTPTALADEAPKTTTQKCGDYTFEAAVT